MFVTEVSIHLFPLFCKWPCVKKIWFCHWYQFQTPNCLCANTGAVVVAANMPQLLSVIYRSFRSILVLLELDWQKWSLLGACLSLPYNLSVEILVIFFYNIPLFSLITLILYCFVSGKPVSTSLFLPGFLSGLEVLHYIFLIWIYTFQFKWFSS